MPYTPGATPSEPTTLPAAVKKEFGKLTGALIPQADGSFLIPYCKAPPTKPDPTGVLLYADKTSGRVKLLLSNGTVVTL